MITISRTGYSHLQKMPCLMLSLPTLYFSYKQGYCQFQNDCLFTFAGLYTLEYGRVYLATAELRVCFSVNTVNHDPQETLVLNFKIISRRSRSRGFLCFWCAWYSG